MELIAEDESTYILRLDAGEEILSSIEAFCAENDVTAGYFSAIGSTDDTVLSYYDLSAKSYLDEKIDDQMEIVSLNGNISIRDGVPFIHAHGCFSDASMYTRAGHVKRCSVFATCEVVMRALKTVIERDYDSITGLDLMV